MAEKVQTRPLACFHDVLKNVVSYQTLLVYYILQLLYEYNLLERIGVAQVAQNDGDDPEDFANLSREDQLRILEQKSWVKNIDFNKVIILEANRERIKKK